MATIVAGAASRGEGGVIELAGKREKALRKTAKTAKMDFRSHGPRWLDARVVGPDQLACTYVFEFSPSR